MANVRSTTTTRPCHLSPTGSRTKCRHRPPHALRRVDDDKEVRRNVFFSRCDGVRGISHMNANFKIASPATKPPTYTRLPRIPASEYRTTTFQQVVYHYKYDRTVWLHKIPKPRVVIVIVVVIGQRGQHRLQ